MCNKKWTIFCWSFNYNSVGGRKWRILTKELLNRGFNVEVICFGDGELRTEIFHPKLKVKELNSVLFNIVRAKWVSHFFGLLFKFINKGVYFGGSDIFALFSNSILSTIELDPKSLFLITTPPFKWSKYIIKYLHRIGVEKSQIYVDLRDRWVCNPLIFDCSNRKAMLYEKKHEFFVLNNVNKLFCSHELDMVYYESLYGVNVVHLANPMSKKEKIYSDIENEKWNIYILGSIYNDSIGVGGVIELINNLGYVYRDLKVTILGKKEYGLVDKCKGVNVTYKGNLVHKEYVRELSKIDFTIIYVSPKMGHAINTKILDSIQYEIPILLVTQGNNYVRSFFEEYNLGIVYDLDNKTTPVLSGYEKSDKYEFLRKVYDPKNITDKLLKNVTFNC